MLPTPLRLSIALLATRCAAGPPVAVGGDAEIDVRPLGDAEYELTLRIAMTTDILAAQRALAPRARETGGNQPVHFGNYAFESVEPLAGASFGSPQALRFSQTIYCGLADVGPVPQATNAPDGWKPTTADQATVEAQTYAYLNSKDEGDFARAYAMCSDSMKGVVKFDSWKSAFQSFGSTAGRVLSRRVVKITWYKDPPSAPMPGVYAAADYAGRYENIPIHCGYVVWYRGPNGEYRVIREEANFLDRATIAKMSADEVKATAARFGCAAD
jgi:uncharacterized protein DUF4019